MNWKVRAGIFLPLLGIVFLFYNIPDCIILMKKPFHVLEEDMEELYVGQHVVMDISMAYDALITVTTEKTENGKKISSEESSRYYAIPSFVYEQDIVYFDHFILIEIESKDFSKAERASDLFAEWWYDETGTVEMPENIILSAEGKLRKLDQEELSYVEDWFEDENYEEYIAPYVFIQLSRSKVLAYVFGGIAMTVVGILLLMMGIREEKAEKEQRDQWRKEIEQTGYYSTPDGEISFNNDRNTNIK